MSIVFLGLHSSTEIHNFYIIITTLLKGKKIIIITQHENKKRNTSKKIKTPTSLYIIEHPVVFSSLNIYPIPSEFLLLSPWYGLA